MRLEQIRTIAKSNGIHTSKRTKTELIKSVQLKEGNFDCFGTAATGECDQSGCSWREDCFASATNKMS